MDSLSSTPGVLALAAGALAVVALISCVAMAVALRRLRTDQRLVLGEGGERDIVAHAAAVEVGFEALRDYVEEVATRLDSRLATAEVGLHRAISHCGLVRYDAYNEMSGRQSMSIALLDSSQSGIVLSSIHHRDQARLYAKQVVDGSAQLELSPEERQAVTLALSGEVQPEGS